MAMSKNYENARIKVNAASAVFMAVQMKYRARTIGDDEFLAAKAVYNEAEKEFDAAFALAQSV